MKPLVDEGLDELKKTYHGLDDLLSIVATDVVESVPPEFQSSLNVLYFPQLGYLIAIEMSLSMKEDKNYQLEGLQFQVILMYL